MLKIFNVTQEELNTIRNSYQKFEQFIINNSKNSMNSAFVFQPQPINHSNPCILIHVIPSNCSKANTDITKKLDELKIFIENHTNFSIIEYPADGDNFYRNFSREQVLNEKNKSLILFTLIKIR